MSFAPQVNLGVLLLVPLITVNYGHVTCRVPKNLKEGKFNRWRIYFLWINKLAFLIEDKHACCT